MGVPITSVPHRAGNYLLDHRYERVEFRELTADCVLKRSTSCVEGPREGGKGRMGFHGLGARACGG